MKIITAKSAAEISISVVSHGQIDLIEILLYDIDLYCRASSIELILTLNLEEKLPFDADRFSFPVKVVRNTSPLGFAANHNQAFALVATRFFCVMNPDIRFDKNPFPTLISCLHNSSIGVSAPLVLGESGELEDSARRFPTPLKILCKVFGRCKGSDYVLKDEAIFPDWVGGMFMLFPSSVFREIGGFDTRFFLYYEDVDLCARLTLRGYRVVMCNQVSVVHHARRTSHTNLRYLWWHIASALRFFFSPIYRQLRYRKLRYKRT